MRRRDYSSHRTVTPSPPEPHARYSRQIVLCIDDEISGLAIRKLLLEEAGYGVLAFADGETALRLFSTRPVYLVITDYAMPGLNGAEVAKTMRCVKPHVPIVMFSGYVEPPKDAKDVADVYIVKGEHPRILLDNVHQLIK